MLKRLVAMQTGNSAPSTQVLAICNSLMRGAAVLQSQLVHTPISYNQHLSAQRHTCPAAAHHKVGTAQC